MDRRWFKLSNLLHTTFLFVFLLISCKSFAGQGLGDHDFDEFAKKIEALKDANPNQAFAELNAQMASVSHLSIENQLVFYKLMAEVYVDQGQYQKSHDVATKALAQARQLASPSIITTELLYARGFAYESLGDYKAAREDYLNGLEIADSLNDKKFVAIGLINLGALDYLMEKFDRSLIMFNDALAIAQQLKDDELSGYIYSELGILYSLINQEEKSLVYYQQSYEHYLKAGKIYYAYNTLRNIATNHSINERYEQAIPLYREIIEHADEISNDELLSYAYSGMAWAQVKQKDSDPEASYQYMLIASQYAENAQQVDFPISHALDKGYLFMELERYQEALISMLDAQEYLQAYEDSDQKMVSTISKINVLYLKAELYFKLEEYEKAYQAQDELLTFALALPEKSNVDEVEDLRMRYESEQADIQKKILEQKESVQAILLADTQNEVENRQSLILLFALVSLILAWALIKTISGQRQLLVVSRTDELTGLANRRRLMQLGESMVKVAKLKSPCSVLVIDVDDFKRINDTFGHKVGDKTLQQVATIGQKEMRQQDVFGRLGGEEFVALLPKTTKEEAINIAEAIRQSVEDHVWSIENEQVSLSIGVATYQQKGTHFNQLLKVADKFMYQAKAQGKNKVCSDE